MPKPPVLPVIDWKAVFESGTTYEQWIAAAESDDNRKQMEDLLTAQTLEPQTEALLRGLPRPVHVLAIAEDWCGDVVRHVPVLQRLAQVTPKLEIRFITREQHPDVFIRFLTNGGEAIPKFVFLSEQWVECGNWGPMPDGCRKIIARGKGCGDVGAARKKTGLMYEADADKRIVVEELIALMDVAAAAAP